MTTIQVECSQHGQQELQHTEETKAEIKNKVLDLANLGKEIHSILERIAQDAHLPELAKIVAKACSGFCSDFHKHDCDLHELGHCHEYIWIDGQKISLCDIEGLKIQLDEISKVLQNCNLSDCSCSELKALLKQAQDIQANMATTVTTLCVKKLCQVCINQNRKQGNAKRNRRFDPAKVRRTKI